MTDSCIAPPNTISIAREQAQKVLKVEAAALLNIAENLSSTFEEACELILSTRGRLIVTGIGKSGHIARKIAATMASTGTPAFFIHPADSLHGDLGMVTCLDVVLALSYSGQSSEIIGMLPAIRRLGCPLISMTGEQNSPLALASTVHLHVPISAEACPLGLAPTTSTTATLGLGDALAMAVSKLRGFTARDFAASHPAGRLGKRLTLQVKDIMHGGEHVPQVKATDMISTGLIEISQKGLGMAAVMAENGTLVGIFTDGDLRRAVDKRCSLEGTSFEQVMSPAPRTIGPDVLLTAAVTNMNKWEVNGLLVMTEDGRLVGAFNIRDVMRTGIL